jgi:hypothetical protein
MQHERALLRFVGRSSWWLLILVLVGLPFLASLPTLQLLAALLITAGVSAVWLLRARPMLCLTAVAVVAWCSRPTFAIDSVDLRVEQPPLALLLAGMLWFERRLLLRFVLTYWLPLLGLMLWLAATFVSSWFVAPDRAASLRIVAWLAFSMSAAAVAAVLAFRAESPKGVGLAFVIAGLCQVGAAFLALLSGRVFGIAWGGYVFTDGTGVFRAFGLAWEPNVFASGLAIVLPFAVDRFVLNGRGRDLLAAVLIGIGVGMGVTRASWIALAVGLACYVAILLMNGHVRVRLPRIGMTFGSVVLAVLAGLSLSNAGTVAPAPLLAAPIDLRSPPPASSDGPLPTPSGDVPGAAPVWTPEPSTAPEDPGSLVNIASGSTIVYRLERVTQSLDDLRASPVIGLGANSYGQRHLDPSQAFRPDYLAMFPITVLYDGGVLALSGLLIFAIALFAVLLKADVRRLLSPYAASIVVMAVAYAATDASRFSQNWLIIGAAFGIAYRIRAARQELSA